LFWLNTPASFSPSEEKDLLHYLDDELEDYFVVEYQGRIVGARGINYFPTEKLVRISWDFVSPDMQGQGIGRRLLLHRIEHLSTKSSIERILVRTSQFSYGFYGKMGFELEKIEEDFWAVGFDLYQMVLANDSQP
jgi:N-acetylglutamate synthase-like GNAT family acetyltransferase